MAATAAAESSSVEIADGPVLSILSKRLRAHRKKYSRILQMEASLAQGKSLNKEQEEVLRSKPVVAALIEEYEKQRQPISAALQEELSLARLSSSAAASSPRPPPPAADDNPQRDPKQAQDRGDSGGEQDPAAAVEDLLNLIYFGRLFDVKPQSEFASMVFTRTHERECCLTYDYVSDDSIGFLQEGDLDLISKLASLVISRPAHSGVSHKNALLGCVQHAKKWLCNSDQPIQPGSPITYEGLRERLNKILASDYYTTTPELKAPGDVAAAVGKYANCQVQVSNLAGLPPSSVTEVSPALYQDMDNAPDDFERKDTECNPSSPVNDSAKDESDVMNDSGDSDKVRQEHYGLLDDAQSQKNVSMDEQYYVQQRTYQNQSSRGSSGRGRRDYVNGRGSRGPRGGGYQNGRNQYYDQYYPRNYYNTRGRGNRGGGSAVHGGHVRATRGGYPPADVANSYCVNLLEETNFGTF